MQLYRINRVGIASQQQIIEEEEGCENCNEDDEERKDVDLIGDSLKRQVLKERESVMENVNQSQY